MNNDFRLMIEDLAIPDPDILMPYIHARRVAASRMYHQGILVEQDLANVGGFFKPHGSTGRCFNDK